jgi:hypothetical protein
MQYKVGDIIVSASGSSYVGEIIYISKEEDVVRHRCRKTGTEYEKSYFGFQCRYMTVEERLEKDQEFCTENIQLHQQILVMEREHNEAITLSKERRESIDALTAEVARREREHAALVETAQKALAHVAAERDLLKNHYSPEAAAKLRAELASARAEVEMLRGAGCREAKLDEPESGPCGVCLKCAEERGAKWALERHGNPFASKTLEQYAEEICCDARRER